jgi:hypothetical protein
MAIGPSVPREYAEDRTGVTAPRRTPGFSRHGRVAGGSRDYCAALAVRPIVPLMRCSGLPGSLERSTTNGTSSMSRSVFGALAIGAALLSSIGQASAIELRVSGAATVAGSIIAPNKAAIE